MGKLPKMKSRTQSAKSRSARRISPLAETTDIKPIAAETKDSGIDLSALSARQGAGITKRKKQKPLSRHQRMRKEKGIARADVVIEKMEKKVGESKKKGKKIKERAAAWEDLNGTKPAKQDPKSMADVDMDVDEDEDESENGVEIEIEVADDAEDEQTAMAEAALVFPTEQATIDTSIETLPADTNGIHAIT